ncbi:Hypothetical protein PHPALM_20429 [Phytophthora palmivora]|uniref:START-like domain n=1 Tax=Phytophthora palmivora TaxID=4796 RepID=A0A2P4XEW1_9STRA|nr:Hypothetical protein PHPALM_20429 [Phytophthora palmivora]
MKGRFIVNPFQELNLTSADRTSLVELANQCISTNLELCMKYLDSKRKVDPAHWKPLKEKEKLKVFSERPEGVAAATAAGNEPTGSGLPMILCVGTKEGKLDDLMYGVISEDLETMRMKASYVDDFSGAAVLDSVVLPTLEDPFQSLVIKWMELDIPFHSTNLVKNRDYVYLEGTGYATNSKGERMGYHLLHSVNFQQTHNLPNRVRGNLSIIGFWRQIGANTMEMYATGVMDPVDAGLVRKLVVPNMAGLFLSSLKYAYCGQMRKLSFMLERRYEESKLHGAPNKKNVCVTCSSPITSRKIGDFGKSNTRIKMKGRFIVNPFQELNLTSADRTSLEDLANQCITSNLQFCMKYMSGSTRRVDPQHWKPLKEKEKLKVYTERPEGAAAAAASGNEPTGSGLPMILCVGTMEGKLEDLLYGVISEDLETMRMKASYVEDFSGAAVLDAVVLPTLEDPFQSLVIKWMELDIPFHSTSLVKNRDYVYLEGTGYVTNSKGERMGYHLLHSVNFPQTHGLPNRVRGNLSVTAFWRQIGNNTMEMYATGVMDPVDAGLVRRLVIPNMANVFLSSLKYAYCGQMRKLSFMLEKAYTDSKLHGAPNRKTICVTCSSPITSRKLGDFGKSNSTCKICFGFVCHACKISRKLSFADPDLLLSQRKVTFCTACISSATSVSSTDCARAMMLKHHKVNHSSLEHTVSSDDNSGEYSYASAQ